MQSDMIELLSSTHKKPFGTTVLFLNTELVIKREGNSFFVKNLYCENRMQKDFLLYINCEFDVEKNLI